MATRAMFWLRWTLRDLRARWLQVLAVALIIGIGSGFYSGLSATSNWRRSSYAASYAATHLYDLRITLATGSYVPQATVDRALAGVAHPRWLAGHADRLTGPVQVDASTARQAILVPATLVGLPVQATGAPVSTIGLVAGRGLGPADAGRDVGVLDGHLARFYGLADQGEIGLSGGTRLRYVGLGSTPENFLVLGPQQQQEPDNAYTVVYTSLQTAGRLLGQPGQTNDVVVAFDPGAPAASARAEVVAALRTALPGTGVTVTARADDPGRTILEHGVASGQRLYTIFALLLLAGAAFGAFNLVVRMVESQRREIGVAMALGTPTPTIARRPLLLALEVALLGVALGVVVGQLVDLLIGGVLRTALPLPVWHTGFQLPSFLVGAALGLLLPLAAVAYPVWRAVRVAPVDAIRTTPTAGTHRGRAGRWPSLHLPGNSIVRMPLRNIVRARRRTLVTLAAIAATTTVLVALMGMVDSFFSTIDTARVDIVADGPNRSTVTLSSFQPVDSATIRAVSAAPGVARASTGIEVGGRLARPGHSFAVAISVVDFGHGVWSPRLVAGRATAPSGSGPGLVVSTAAARDLHVGVGSAVRLTHPRRTGLTSYDVVTDSIPVVGITPLPTRQITFLDQSYASLLGLQGLANQVDVAGEPSTSSDTLLRTLFAIPGVAAVESPQASVEAMSRELDEVLSVLRIVDVALVGLAGLIAFNAASINFDERAREQATMFAFGLPPREVMALALVESLLVGLAGAAVGLVAGRVLLSWMIGSVMHSVVPDITLNVVLRLTTAVEVVLLTALAVLVAPLVSYPRLSRMDVPSTLRVME